MCNSVDVDNDEKLTEEGRTEKQEVSAKRNVVMTPINSNMTNEKLF
jgi:hypothetical protein